MKRRQVSTPLKELQRLYDVAKETYDRSRHDYPKLDKALEKVRLHFGLKEHKP